MILTLILPIFLFRKCCLLFTSAAYIHKHSRLFTSWKQTLWSDCSWCLQCVLSMYISRWESRQQSSWMVGKGLRRNCREIHEWKKNYIEIIYLVPNFVHLLGNMHQVWKVYASNLIWNYQKICPYFENFFNLLTFHLTVYYSAIRSLSSHTPNWFLSPLALQETWTSYTIAIQWPNTCICIKQKLS